MPNPYNRKLTDELIGDIAKAVQIGTHPEVAARAFGIGRSTFLLRQANPRPQASALPRVRAAPHPLRRGPRR